MEMHYRDKTITVSLYTEEWREKESFQKGFLQYIKMFNSNYFILTDNLFTQR